MPPELSHAGKVVMTDQRFPEHAPHYAEELLGFFPKLHPYLQQAPWVVDLMAGVARKYPEDVVNHSIRAALLAEKVATEVLKVNFVQKRPLVEALLVHDIGKENLPEEIVQGEGRLSDGQIDEMKLHALWSVQAVYPHSSPAAFLVEQVHRFARSGDVYPAEPTHDYMQLEPSSFHPMLLSEQGIEKLPTLCDVIDAMRSKRSYKEGCSLEKTFQAVMALRDVEGRALYDSEEGRKFVLHVIEAWDEVNREFEERLGAYKAAKSTLSNLSQETLAGL